MRYARGGVRGKATSIAAFVVLLACGGSERSGAPPASAPVALSPAPAPPAPSSAASDAPPAPPVFAARVDTPRAGTETVAAGDGFSCALDPDAHVLCWGRIGASLDGAPPPGRRRLLPVRGLDGSTSIAASSNTLCGVGADGQVRCAYIDSRRGAFQPVAAVPGLDDAIAISARMGDPCALRRDGGAVCWEMTYDAGSGTHRPGTPAPLWPELGSVVEVAAGWGARCVRLSTGAVHCRDDEHSSPHLVLTGAVSVDADREACAALEDGSVWCWGDNQYGVLGDGTETDSSTPVRVRGLPFAAVRVFVQLATVCALSAAGELVCWGNSEHGEAGDGHRGHRLVPGSEPVLTHVISVAPGDDHVCARDAAGDTWCWGWNLGGETAPESGTDWHEIPDLEGVSAIALGDAHACALDAEARVWCWGTIDAIDQAGTLFLDAPTPIEIAGLRGATQIAAGMGLVCALAGGRVRCFGSQRNPVLAMPSTGTDDGGVWEPIDVAGTEGASALALDGGAACIVRGGQVLCWGDTSRLVRREHALADVLAPAASVSAPTRVEGIDDASALALGPFGCARSANGAWLCWGERLDPVRVHDVFGDDTFRDQYVAPAPVAMLAGADDVVLGLGGGCARFGREWRCFGRAEGEGLAAVRVPDLAGAVDVHVDSAVCGVWDDGHARCSAAGRRAIGRSDRSQLPVRGAERLTGVRRLAATELTLCALLDTGRVTCCGDARDGVLGDGRSDVIRVPTRVSLAEP